MYRNGENRRRHGNHGENAGVSVNGVMRHRPYSKSWQHHRQSAAWRGARHGEIIGAKAQSGGGAWHGEIAEAQQWRQLTNENIVSENSVSKRIEAQLSVNGGEEKYLKYQYGENGSK